MCNDFIRIFQGRLNALRWRHNERNCVSKHQPRHCLLNRLFGRRSKKTSKLRVTGLYAGNSPGTGEFPALMASNAENVSIWWRHHGQRCNPERHVQTHRALKWPNHNKTRQNTNPVYFLGSTMYSLSRYSVWNYHLPLITMFIQASMCQHHSRQKHIEANAWHQKHR